MNKPEVYFLDEAFIANEKMLQAGIKLTREKTMLQTYLVIHVYDDGDTELTKKELTPDNVRTHLLSGDVCYHIEDLDNIKSELSTYGHENDSIDAAVKYVIDGNLNDPCIVGKV